MTVQPLLKFPDARLRMPAGEVRDFGPGPRALADDLLDTMRAAPGIGITAPHIGVLQRLATIELPDEGLVRVYANPHIVWSSRETSDYAEGSVSMPGVVETIKRSTSVRVDYQDLDGVPNTEEANGLLAVCLQHEIDQLDGIFWIYRLSRLKRERVEKRYGKLDRSIHNM